MNQKQSCKKCEGNGYTAEHDSASNHSPEDGTCITCPIQVQCENCLGTGELKQSWEEDLVSLLKKQGVDILAEDGQQIFLEQKELIKQAIQTREREIQEEYENKKHFVLPPAVPVDLSDMEMIKCCDVAVAKREREISEEVGKIDDRIYYRVDKEGREYVNIKSVLSIINNISL